jgi:hypothetical protein
MDEVFSWNVAQELVGKQPAERRRLISQFRGAYGAPNDRE